MTEEAANELRSMLEAAKLASGPVGQLFDRVWHDRLQGLAHHGIAALLGIELGRVGKEEVSRKPSAEGLEEGPRALGAMQVQPVSHDQQRRPARFSWALLPSAR